jgi:arylsulfatase A-like enzyme
VVAKPRLVVVVSYDQFRGDFPSTFARFASSRGFNRVMREGVWFPNCFFRHASLMTGPGHATLLTGCYPHRHGIPANDICDASLGRCLYCADDTSGVRSPFLLRVPTVGDVLRASDSRSKVAAIAYKDRSAILMAGRSAYPVLWFDGNAGGFVTSTFYRQPPWLSILNSTLPFTRWSNHTWRTGIPDSLSPATDDVDGEGALTSGKRVFPHRMPDAQSAPRDYVADFIRSPYAVTHLFDAARELMRRERLGQDTVPDILCIGVSQTDFLGHTFGPDSREVQEMYRACDTTLAGYIDYLDDVIGREHYVLMITSDHGVAPIPEVIRRAGEAQGVTIDAGRLRRAMLRRVVDSTLSASFGTADSVRWVRTIHEPALYLDHDSCLQRGVNPASAADVAARALRGIHGLQIAMPTVHMVRGDSCHEGVPPEMCAYVKNAVDTERSGDVVFFPQRYWIVGATPATHGTPHDYDRHVPLMLFGGGFSGGRRTHDVSPADIAPTIATWLGLDLGDVDGVPLPLTMSGGK